MPGIIQGFTIKIWFDYESLHVQNSDLSACRISTGHCVLQKNNDMILVSTLWENTQLCLIVE